MHLRVISPAVVVMFMAAVALAAEPPTRASSGVIDVLVDGEHCRGAHVSTRPHNRKVVYHEDSGTWFVFYGTGHWTEAEGEAGAAKENLLWRASADGGVTWGPAQLASDGNGHSSSACAVLWGDRVFLSNTRWGYWRRKAGIPALIDGKAFYKSSKPGVAMYYVPYDVHAFRIEGGKLLPDGGPYEALPGDQHVMHAGPHYGSMCRDGNGYLWVAARALMGDPPTLAAWVARSTGPDDPSAWEPHSVIYHSPGPGTVAPQVVALAGGRVGCMVYSKHDKATYFLLFDAESGVWSEPLVVGRESGRSKRTCAAVDPGTGRLHFVYIDENEDARHRYCEAPYGPGDWVPAPEEPGVLVARSAGSNSADDDLTLSVRGSKSPAPLALVHRGTDQRLHLKYYDGTAWHPQDVPIGLQDPKFTCDEATAIEDFSHGLGFAYWCRWADRAEDERHNSIGMIRFCRVDDVAALFEGIEDQE